MKSYMKFIFAIICGVYCVGLSAADCFARENTDILKSHIVKFLQGYLDDDGSGNPDLTTTYSYANVALSGDKKKEIIVYVTGQTWCGSGGCIMLVLSPSQSTFRVISKTYITRLPIHVLSTKSHGWRDISVWVQGGGIQPGYAAVLSFNGKRYPSNPTVDPARPLKKHDDIGEIVPLKWNGELLYH